jgi:2-keto-4-pentenoate hydratase/2-oxohepta-3-ene-1,7-dioic acid hydratase in catechol pathway
MRIVRYLESWQDVPNEWFEPLWGMLVDDLIFPLETAPWLRTGRGKSVPILRGDSEPFPLADSRLLAPVTPGKIVCVGRNYADHAAETGSDVPPEPLIFLKATTSLLAPEGEVVYPSISKRVDHEAELAVVIGARCRFVSEADALNFVFGYTAANDVTARDLQTSDGQWSRAKGFDTFCPVGPWIDTRYDPSNRRITCQVNGQKRQDSSTSDMIFSVARIISHISQAMTLEPGDLILTGTPSGISAVNIGDVMTVEVEGLGTLSNRVIAEADYRSALARARGD